MNRAEKRLRAREKRTSIYERISEVILEELDLGKTVEEAFLAADNWVNFQMKLHPQEKQMYKDAAREFAERFWFEYQNAKIHASE